MKPTNEQQAIIDALSSREMIKAQACAGSGKTTLLNMVASSTYRPGLYLAFNKSMAEEASSKFPRRISCKTTHALAYRAMQMYRHPDKLKRPRGFDAWTNYGYYASEIAELLDLPSVGNITPESLGVAVRFTVERFQQSADERVDLSHTVLPKSFSGLKGYLLDADRKYSQMSDEARVAALEADLQVYEKRIRKLLADKATDLWEARIDPKSRVLMDHDTYLKSFCLSRPDLGQDLIFLDEAQDTTDCVLRLLLEQAERGTQLVLVGDRRQAIYRWRGATNAMAKVSGGCLEFPLSQSWRFGPRVGDIAEVILEYDIDVLGNPALDTRIEDIDRYPYTGLYRTNAGLLEDALQLLERDIPVRMVLDVRPFARKLESAYYLYDGKIEQVRDEEIRGYGHWDVLMQESGSDPELARIARMVEEKEDDIPRQVDLLNRYQAPRNPAITLCTAHKSKGLEWPQVRLGNDYRSPKGQDGEWKGLCEDEQNLLYVAATRATDVLEINATVREILDHEREEVGG